MESGLPMRDPISLLQRELRMTDSCGCTVNFNRLMGQYVTPREQSSPTYGD